jgi:hypothetical protein
MIKITADKSVEDALQRAFPRPQGAAYRALAKYISTVEAMINEAVLRGQTPQEKKLGTYSISTSDLANKGGKIGSQKIRVHKWLRENNLEIVQTVVTGSKFTGQFSQVKLSKLVTVTDDLQVLAAGLAGATTDEEIDAYLSGDDVSNAALFDYLYPEYQVEWRPEKLKDLFDWVPVDIPSVKAYVVWLETESQLIKGVKRDTALRQALTIIGVATHTRGHFVQRRKVSPFGRLYYEGTSVQNVNKELRRAMLGNCWEYDIRSSVIAWKMGFARSYLLDHGLALDIKAHFPWSLLYLEHKADFLGTIRHYVFTEGSPVPRNFQLALLKQAFTAISFGARQSATGWLDASGNWNNPALVEIIKNGADRDRFLADQSVQGFIKEQGLLDDYLFAAFKERRPLLCHEPYLQTDSGRLSKAKVLAYLYQHDETAVMNVVVQAAQAKGRAPIARVHDAIFFKTRLGADLKGSIEWQMREQTGNPYWHLTPEQLQRYQPKSLNEQQEEIEHRKRIAEQEALAKGYVPEWPKLFGQESWDT